MPHYAHWWVDQERYWEPLREGSAEYQRGTNVFVIYVKRLTSCSDKIPHKSPRGPQLAQLRRRLNSIEASGFRQGVGMHKLEGIPCPDRPGNGEIDFCPEKLFLFVVPGEEQELPERPVRATNNRRIATL